MIDEVIALERVAPEALPSLIANLYLEGPDRIRVSIASAPAGVAGEAAATVRPLSVWYSLFDLAGFVVASEDVLDDSPEPAEWTAASHWARFDPFRDDGGGRRFEITLRRRQASAPTQASQDEMRRTLGIRPVAPIEPRPLHPESHLVFLVGTYQEFRQYQALWPALPSPSFTVLLRDGGSDAGWLRRRRCMEAWLTLRGISWRAVSDVRSVRWDDWTHQHRVLVVGADSTVFPSHVLNAAFVAAARTRGWKTVQLQHGIWPYADATAPMTMMSALMLTWSGEFREKLREPVRWPDGSDQPRGHVEGTRFITTGCPSFDRYADAHWPRLEHLLGDWVAPYRRRVLVATNLHWSQHRDGARVNPAILDLARRHEDTLFIVKTHPAHDPDDGFVRSCPPNVQVLDEFCCLFADLDSARLVLAVDAVICTLSTVALEAAIGGRPFIVIDTGNPNRYEHVVPVAPERLHAAYAALVDVASDGSAFVDHYLGSGTVGRATRAVFDAIAAEIGRPHAPLAGAAVLQPILEAVSSHGVENFALQARIDELERRLDERKRELDAVTEQHGRIQRIAREKDIALLGILSRPAKVGLFGASSAGTEWLNALRASGRVDVRCFFDNDPARWGSSISGVRVVRPSPDAFDEVDFIVVSSIHVDAISQQVAAAGYGGKLLLDPAVLMRDTSPETIA